MKKLYRYEIDYLSQDNETGVDLREHPVIRETEHTYFIKQSAHSTKLKQIRKLRLNESEEYFNRFAYTTKKGARIHFQRRTMKRISWYKYWIKECEKALEIIKE